MTTEPTEARQDELAGIREKMAREFLEARQTIGAIARDEGMSLQERKENADIAKEHFIDQILNLTVSSGGGVCPDCRGTKEMRVVQHGNPYDPNIPSKIRCCRCNGTGQKPIVTKELREIINNFIGDE